MSKGELQRARKFLDEYQSYEPSPADIPKLVIMLAAHERKVVGAAAPSLPSCEELARIMFAGAVLDCSAAIVCWDEKMSAKQKSIWIDRAKKVLAALSSDKVSKEER